MNRIAKLIGALRNPPANLRAMIGWLVVGWAIGELHQAATEMSDAANEAEARLGRLLVSEEEAHAQLRAIRAEVKRERAARPYVVTVDHPGDGTDASAAVRDAFARAAEGAPVATADVDPVFGLVLGQA